MPRSPINAAEASEIRRFREEIHFRAANGAPLHIRESPESTAWTVVADRSSGFPRTPLNRFIFVKPLPADLAELLRPLRRHLSAVGVWPATREGAVLLSEIGVKRICPLGRMQQPPLTWHQDGFPVLASLVDWVDLELE
jgi:hypothetical protein